MRAGTVELESFIEAERQRYNGKSAGLVGMDVEKIFWAAQINYVVCFCRRVANVLAVWRKRSLSLHPPARAGGQALAVPRNRRWFNRGFSKPINGAGPALFDD